MMALKAEANLQDRTLKEVASEIILCGVSDLARSFVESAITNSVVYDDNSKGFMPNLAVHQGKGNSLGIVYVKPETDDIHVGDPVYATPDKHDLEKPGLEMISSKPPAPSQPLKALEAEVTRAPSKNPRIEDNPGMGEKIIALRAEGKSYSEIAKITGYSKAPIGKFLKYRAGG